MPTVEGLQEVAKLNSASRENIQAGNDFVNRKAAAQKASQLYQSGDIEGAIGAMIEVDPEFAKQISPSLLSVAPGIQQKLKMGQKTGELEAETAYGSNPAQLAAIKAKGDAMSMKSLKIFTRTMEDGTQRNFQLLPNGQTVDLGLAGGLNRHVIDPVSGESTVFTPAAASSKVLQSPGKVAADKIVQEAKEAGTQDDPKPLYQSLNPVMRKNYDAEKDKYVAEVKDNRDAIQAGYNTIEMINAGKENKGDILRAFQNQLARATGERGVMTEQDVAPFGGLQGITDVVKRAATYKMTGQIPEADRKFLKAVAETMRRSTAKAIDSKADLYASQIATTTSLTKEQAKKLLTQDAVGERQAIKPGEIKQHKNGNWYRKNEDGTFTQVQK